MQEQKKRTSKGLRFDEEGATAVEYGLLLALMVLALIGALAATGSSTQDQWDGVSNKVGSAMDGASGS
ncbi:MAG: Flp family type IVb pilin [Pseudomonadota bacterium]